MADIVGTLSAKHSVDQNGSLSIDVPLQLPPAKMAPDLSISYHSAANNASAIGVGWTIKGASYIERVPATVGQDGLRGSVNYDGNDRFSLDGQRLISIGNNEYRFELEKWSKIVANGSNPANPDYWVEYLPDGSNRTFGNTSDSNIKAAGGTGTRAWAVSQNVDSFKNYVSCSYVNDSQSGAFYLDQVKYGGNQTLSMDHQRTVKFNYDQRPDIRVKYLGGYKISTEKRLASITTSVKGSLAHTHLLNYDPAPLTGVSRLTSITLADASGAKVRPLKFNWVDGNPAVFDSVGQSTVIDPQDSTAIVMAMDVHASGKSDLVVASKRFSGSDKLHLDVFRPDANGIISSTPDSSFDGMDYPTQLLPLDFNGDGRNDLLHITTGLDSHTLTVLLSTPTGYQAQTPLVFKPEFVGGSFHVGDFEGNGRVGLCYMYQIFTSGPQLRFVQFVSDGQKFTPLDPGDGPSGVSFDQIKVVVGDLDGDNAEDVFIMYSSFKNGGNKVQIELLQSDPNGRLKYRDDKPLVSVAESIFWTDNITFLPYSADEDGKTSLLVVTNDLNGNLQLQMIRSSGPTLLPPTSPIQTNIAYNGNATLAKTSSTIAVDLVNTFQKQADNPPHTEVTVLRFFNDTFTVLDSVKQPGILSTSVNWADLRGLGRVDCVLNTVDFTGKITVTPMPSAASQPIDYISGYENGLGAALSVLYAPLSDQGTYTADSDNSPLSAVNAMARNVSFSADLATSSVSQSSAHTRSQIVYFPSYVVKQTKRTPYAARSDVIDQTDYTYKNARYGYDGRGWRGFETVTKTSAVLGSSTATDYYQDFPLIGQAKEVRVSDSGNGKLLQTTTNTWETIGANNNKTKFICLSQVKESNYEAGSLAYDVNVDYDHDDYGNITSMTLDSPQTGTPALSISATFVNDPSSWVIGQKTLETVKRDQTVLKQTKRAYQAGSLIAKEESKWVAADIWSTQTFEFDATGNEAVVTGPGNALRKFTYDETYTNLASSSVHTASNADPLTESAVFDLVTGKPLSSTTPNGEITSIKYDILGRMVEASITTAASGTKVVEKQAFETDGTHFYQIAYTENDTDDSDVWFKTVSHLDGMNRVWRTEVPRPDDPSKLIYSDIEYDGSGRIVKRARDYFADSSPSYATFIYDPLSRLTKQTLPPAAAGVSPITSTVEYSFINGTTHVKETRSDGQSSNDVVTSREILHLPNPEPSATNFTKPFVTTSVNELNQTITTVYDGLGRPISISDPSGTSLFLTWDGIGRATTRRIANSDGGTSTDINHITAKYEDDLGKLTITNELTGTTSVTTSDWAKRPISKVTPDETFTYSYDVGGTYTKEQLVSVSSSKGIKHNFDYDQRGNLTTSTVSIDSHDYTSSYQWSLSGELLRITNPDGTTISRTLYADGETVKRVELADSGNSVRAWANLGEYNDTHSRPLSCEFGNGVTATSTLADNGSIADISLSKNGDVLHRQSWKLDAFSRISQYDVDIKGLQEESGGNLFKYNTAGQLVQRQPDSATVTDSAVGNALEDFMYDDCGNLKSKGGKTFVNKGWQLSQIQNSTGATEFSFKYSADGNMTSKLDGSGQEKASMTYDSEGHLVTLNNTNFVYDFGGRLLKATLPNGDVRIYPSQSYEVDISSAGETTHTAYLVQGYRRASLTTKGTSSTVYYFHTDHLGSIVAVSDDSGSVVTQYKYDSFGQVRVIGNDLSRYKFSGKEIFDGLYYFGARFYDPDTGRFLTLDNYPIELDGVRPSTFNMYSFCRNDPINFIDLNGNVPWWHWLVDAILVVVGVALMFVPGVNAIVLGIVTGAIIGAGMAGLSYDVSAQISGKSDDKEWGVALGLGALFGGISGGLAAGVDAMLPAVTVVDVLSNSGAIGARMIGSWVLRTVVRVGIKTAVESGLGVLKQMSKNGIEGKRWDEGLGDAAAMGALTGFGSALKSEASAFLKPLKGEGFKLKFWKDRNWRVYKLAEQEKLSSLGQINKNVDYPLRSLDPQLVSYRELGDLSTGISVLSNSQGLTRFLPIELANGL